MARMRPSKLIIISLAISAFIIMGGVVYAIVVKTPKVASVQTANTQGMPHALAARTLPPKAGEGAFDTPFFSATEEPLTLAEFKGRGLVVNFWATWCVPCVHEMPALDRLAKALKGSGIEVITISEDRKALEKVPPFFAELGLKNLDLYYDVNGALSRKLGTEGLPTTILITQGGVDLGHVMGAVEWDSPEIEAYLRQALAPKKIPLTE